MLRFLAMLQGQVRRIAPSIRLASEESDAFFAFRRGDEGGEVCWQRRQRELIDDAVTFVIPGEAGVGKKCGQAGEGGDQILHFRCCASVKENDGGKKGNSSAGV